MKRTEQKALWSFGIDKVCEPVPAKFTSEPEPEETIQPQAHVFTVQELTKYIKKRLEGDSELSNLWVKGEISNFKHHSSGHMYFTLKDKNSQIRSVMFRENTPLKFTPEDGMDVLARGNIGVYEKRGDYQLYVLEIQPEGIGALHVAFEQLKKKLKEEGLFDEGHKKSLPVIPRKIGIVTSPTGAAIRDIINVSRRRFPNVHIIVAPVRVQGEMAKDEIVRAIEVMNTQDIDLMIVGRGGGSLEELWAFNEEIVARAIYSSKVPIISGVGHETDFTIADFVADKRAPTPSAAAEIALPEKKELIRNIQTMRHRLDQSISKRLDLERKHLQNIIQSVIFRKPKSRIDQHRQHMDDLIKQLNQAATNLIKSQAKDLDGLIGKLDTLSPLSILSRGYSVSLKMPDKKIVKKIAEVGKGDLMRVIVTDGEIFCEVNETKKVRRDIKDELSDSDK
ncbi:MAG: exodeoxyribonuclease VII large subunit [Halobacteriota archaeon]|nr:exodeoxyribonuclease VII large subunit [Halobacteriota archaeon]